jgi:hypothetical protein
VFAQVTKFMQSGSGLQAALMALSQVPAAWRLLMHVLHVASAAAGDAAQSVALHCVLQLAAAQTHP